jgi:hypothetical protein
MTKTILPEPGNNILKFEKTYMQIRKPFVIYCDFEASNQRVNDPESPNKLFHQTGNSYNIYVKSDYCIIYSNQNHIITEVIMQQMNL